MLTAYERPLAAEDAAGFLASYLSECVAQKREPAVPSALLRNVAQCAALLRSDLANGTGPARSTWPIDEEPAAFWLRFSSDGRRLFYQGNEGLVALDTATGRATPLLRGDREGCAVDRSRSPDGRLSTDRADFVGLYDTERGRLLRRCAWERFSNEACTVNVVFSPDGERIAVSYAYDPKVRLFAVASAELLVTLLAADHEADLAFSPDGRWLLAASKSGVRLWDLNTGLSVLPAQRFRSYCAAFHPQGDRIVVSDEGPVLHLIDLAPMQQVATPTLEALAAYLQQHQETLAARGGTHWDNLAVVCRLL